MNLSEGYMKSQSGRTMLEILIVVALVGLLSLLPLEVYNYAIDKYRSNVLKDEILQRSADLKQQIDHHKKNFNLDKWDPYSKIGVPIDIVENDTYEQNSIGIKITDIEKRICNMMLDGLENLEKIRVNDILYNADSEPLCRGNDKIIFYFDPLPNRSVKNNLQDHCPSDTPKGADPDTCKCDLTQRYFQESTNECICWSGEEIDGVCMNFCATSAACDENEICENHICIKYDNATTMEPINTTEVSETTYITSTATPETTSTSSTPLSSTTTTSVYETSASKTIMPTTTKILTTSYETTIPTTTEILTTPYETTLPVTTLPVCSSEAPIWDGMKCVTCASFGEKPYWNAETKQCEVCPGTQIWDADNHTCIDCPTNYIHSINGGPLECLLGCPLNKPLYVLSGSRKGQCVACPSDKPYYNSKLFQCEACPISRPFFDTRTRTCTECPLDTPVWDSSASRCFPCDGYWNTTLKQCLDDCSSQNPYFYQSSSITTKQCVSTCPFDKPAVQNNKCTTCYDIHGTSAPYWNSQTKQCEDCPRNTSWNNDEQQCMATNCSGVYSWLSSGLEITEFQMCSRYAGRDVYHHVGKRINSAYIYGERKPSECRNHALRASGYIYAFKDGNYTFKTHAYSCSEHSNKVEVQITIDNKLVHNVTSACSTGTVTLALTAGLHKINYYMYTFKRATAYLELQTSGAFFCSD